MSAKDYVEIGLLAALWLWVIGVEIRLKWIAKWQAIVNDTMDKLAGRR